ncbi:putative quinol monooxygenase [Alcanivorax sp.]|uniref:putative quinol monooxygenase n=1 Tax=Alcanivorax sp. TaxID=1872427 RepID=UPI000C5B22E5|nr:putative quinol monooxygenase [Alcanivorax sp.]MBQ24322.1 antibiotic biosynthesis monooxygenase [Alcanivorax sp.]
MIIVKGSFPVKEDEQPQALELVQALASASRGERGCLAYEVYLQADAPRVIMVWQQWSNLDALEIHFGSEHVDAFLDAIPDMIDGDVTSARFDVSSMDGDPIVEDVSEIAPVVLADNIILH